MERWARISECGAYRYTLGRQWDTGGRRVLWVMLNPSTADADVDDATIRKCVGFTKLWGGTELEVVNLFALRSTQPAALYGHPHAVGPGNNRALMDAFDDHRVTRIVAAWGNHGALEQRGKFVAHDLMLCYGRSPLCFGRTKSGQPKHPLYIPYTKELELF